MRRCVEAEPFDTPSGSLKVTVSIGVAERQAGAPLDRAMKDADIALYASKSAGRNRVTVTSSGGGVVRNETLARDAA